MHLDYKWFHHQINQNPKYDDVIHLSNACNFLKSLNPFLTYEDIDNTLDKLAKIHLSEDGFIIHAGDCAERFIDCHFDISKQKFVFLNSLAFFLSLKSNKNIQVIFRNAGQFGKPRTSENEVFNGKKLDVFRGDLIHSFKADEFSRVSDSDRLILGYFLSSIIHRDFLICQNSQNLDIICTYLYKIITSSSNANLQATINSLYGGSIDFNQDNFCTQPLLISHEALSIFYEDGLTRLIKSFDKNQTKLCNNYYNLAANLLWLGERTRQIKSCHVEYLSMLKNPIAIKIGPSVQKGQLSYYLNKLNPNKLYGKLVIIPRLGYKNTHRVLKNLLKEFKKSDIPAMWICDPMHGNTLNHPKTNYKTRYLNHIMDEITYSYDLYTHYNIKMHGIHLEITHEDVLECLDHHDQDCNKLNKPYLSYCDPRLNKVQTLTIMDHIGNLIS